MIRRDVVTTAARQWILISQVDHAQLAGRLAEHWGAGGVAPLAAEESLLWAIYHHDDGWRAWEQSPDVDPHNGRPRSFTEMELGDSLDIWGRSITAAAEHGPLEGHVVAGHFCALLRRFDFGWRNDPSRAAAANEFFGVYERLREDCLRAWLSDDPEHTPERAAMALAQLQLFDTLSLWFCCAAADESDVFETPAGPPITVAPVSRHAGTDPTVVSLAPWPLAIERVNLEVPGRAIPARAYQNHEDLASAPAQSVLLRWQVVAPGRMPVPGPPKS